MNFFAFLPNYHPYRLEQLYSSPKLDQVLSLLRLNARLNTCYYKNPGQVRADFLLQDASEIQAVATLTTFQDFIKAYNINICQLER